MSTKSKRAQILMSPDEYRKLEKIARARNLSVAELIRSALQERYLVTDSDRAQSLQRIFSLGLPDEDWSDLEEDVAAAHSDDIH